jgi:hypothetical protein
MPPDAPLKEQSIPESDVESESQSQLLQQPAKIFSNLKLQFNKTYKGPVLHTYVNTGVCKGWSNDYY